MTFLTVAAEVASVLSFILLVVGYDLGRRQSIAHLCAHVEVLQIWAAGHDGSGWDRSTITPADELIWRNPAWNVVINESGGGLSQLTIDSSIFLPRELTPYIVRTAQSVASFNQALLRYEAFKLGDIRLMLTTQDKLSRAFSASFGGSTLPPPDTTVTQLRAVLQRAGLTEEEEAYSHMLFKMMAMLHVETIGRDGGKGLARHVAALAVEMRRASLTESA